MISRICSKIVRVLSLFEDLTPAEKRFIKTTRVIDKIIGYCDGCHRRSTQSASQQFYDPWTIEARS